MNRLLLPVLSLALPACAGLPELPTDGTEAPLQVRATVFGYPAPIAGVQVSAFGDLNRSILRDSGETDANGEVALEFFQGSGPLWICTSNGGGTYPDIMTGVTNSLGQRSCRFVPDVAAARDGNTLTVSITPWSNLAVALAHALPGGFEASYAQAKSDLNRFVACGQPFNVVDASPVSPVGDLASTDLTANTFARVISAGLSGQAHLISLKLQKTPGYVVTADRLNQGWIDDCRADGKLNAIGTAGDIEVDEFVFGSGVYRTDTGPGGQGLGWLDGIRHFLRSDANDSGLAETDLEPFVQCVATATDGVVGSDDVVAELDRVGPTIQFLELPADNLARGEVIFGLLASDASAVDSLILDAMDGITALSPERRPDGTFVVWVTWDSSSFADGDVEFVARASDVAGNASEARLTLQANNWPPQIQDVTWEPTGESLEGTVNLRVCADDLDEVAAMDVLAFGDTSLTFVRELETSCWSASVDTSQYRDGEHSVLVDAYDSSGNLQQRTQKVVIDNADDGLIRGVIAAETPVTGEDVRGVACTVDDHGFCVDYIAPINIAGDGTYEIQMPHWVRDTIRIVISGGSYGTLGGHRVALSSRNVRFSRTLRYEAGRPGVVRENVVITPFTTWGDHRALYEANHGGVPYFDAVEESYDLISEHHSGGLGENGVDIRTTAPRDFVSDSPLASLRAEDSTRLGLALVGLSQCQRSTASYYGTSPDAVSSLDAIQKFLEDVDATGRNDGWKMLPTEEAPGTPVTVFDEPITSNFLRSQIGGCVASFLVSENNPTRGDERLTPNNYNQPNGFLAQMAEGASPESLQKLFGAFAAEETLVFDQTGADVTGGFVNGNDAWGLRPLKGQVALFVNAMDPSYFPQQDAITVEVLGLPEGQAQPFGPNQIPLPRQETSINGRFLLNTRDMDDGDYTVRITVRDRGGNVSVELLDVAVDNNPPAGSFTAADSLVGWPDPAVLPTARVAGMFADVVGPIETLECFVDGVFHSSVPFEVSEDPNTPGWVFDHQVDFAECDAVKQVEIRATDFAGNSGSLSRNVECDATPTALSYEDTEYDRRDFIDVIKHQNRLIFVPKLNSKVKLSNAWKEGQAPEIHKDLSRLDVWSDNPVVIKISASDSTESGSVFTPPSQLVARYQLWKEPAEGAPVLKRNWTAVSAEVSGATARYFIPISYQTLHADLWKTRPGTVHRVTLQVSDRAGNTTEQHTRFKVRIYSPPAFVSNCRYYPEELDRFSLAGNRLEDLLSGLVNPKISSCEVTYLLDVRPDSLAPRTPVRVDTVQSMPTDWSIETRVAFDTWPWSQRTRGRHMHCFPQPWPPVRDVTYFKGPWHYFHKTWVGGACEDGLVFPSSNPDINGPRTRSPDPGEDRVEDYTISWDPQLDRYSNVSDQNGQVVNPLGGSYGIAPDNRHSVEYRLRSRGLLKNGEPMSWSWKNYHSGHQLLHLGRMYRDDGTQAFYTEMRTRHFVDFSPPHDFMEFRLVSKWLYASKVTLRYGMSPLTAYHPELASEVNVHHEGDCASSTMASFVTEEGI